MIHTLNSEQVDCWTQSPLISGGDAFDEQNVIKFVTSQGLLTRYVSLMMLYLLISVFICLCTSRPSPILVQEWLQLDYDYQTYAQREGFVKENNILAGSIFVRF
jgi:hypothetical protein